MSERKVWAFHDPTTGQLEDFVTTKHPLDILGPDDPVGVASSKRRTCSESQFHDTLIQSVDLRDADAVLFALRESGRLRLRETGG